MNWSDIAKVLFAITVVASAAFQAVDWTRGMVAARNKPKPPQRPPADTMLAYYDWKDANPEAKECFADDTEALVASLIEGGCRPDHPFLLETLADAAKLRQRAADQRHIIATYVTPPEVEAWNDWIDSL